MKEAVIMTKDEYGQLIKRLDELQKTCTGLNVDLCWWHDRYNNLYDAFNRPAIKEAEKFHREDDLLWCERIASEHEEKELHTWCEEQAHLYNNGIMETCKKHQCQPEDIKYLGWDYGVHEEGFYEPTLPDKRYFDEDGYWAYDEETTKLKFGTKSYWLNDMFFYYHLLLNAEGYYSSAVLSHDDEYANKLLIRIYDLYKDIVDCCKKAKINNPVNTKDFPVIDKSHLVWCEETAKRF